MCATESFGDPNSKTKVWLVHRPSVDGAGVSQPHFDLLSKASVAKSCGHGKIGSWACWIVSESSQRFTVGTVGVASCMSYPMRPMRRTSCTTIREVLFQMTRRRKSFRRFWYLTYLYCFPLFSLLYWKVLFFPRVLKGKGIILFYHLAATCSTTIQYIVLYIL